MKCVDNMYVKEDHWDTLTELGSGRFGTCFLAADRQTQAVFAAKKVHTHTHARAHTHMHSRLW